MPKDSLQTIKEIGENIGFGAAPVALTTGNQLANIITVVSAVAIVLPKLADIFHLLKNLFNKNKNLKNNVTIN